MRLRSSRISGFLGAIAIAASTIFTSGYGVSACECGCQCSTNTNGQNGGTVVVGDNTKVYGDIVVSGSSNQGSPASNNAAPASTPAVPAFTCVPEVIDVTADVHIRDTLEMNGTETTYGFVVGQDVDDNCYAAALPESEYQKYVNAEDETTTVKVYKVTVQQDSSSRAVFERYSFPWKPEDRAFTEAEIMELKGIVESGSSYEIEDIKAKYSLDYCKIDDNKSGLSLTEQEEPVGVDLLMIALIALVIIGVLTLVMCIL